MSAKLERLVCQFYEQEAAQDDAEYRAQLIRDNPELRAELQDFFAAHDRLQGVTNPAHSNSPAVAEGNWIPIQPVSRVSRDDPFPETLVRDQIDGFGARVSHVGQRFGEYEIDELIARGGMGIVYRARHVSLNRTVALKMILSGQWAGEEEVRRFNMEAAAAAKLEHPAIVPIYEVGQSGDQRYFSMAFVDGPTLAEHLKERGPLPHFEAAELALRIAEAVAYAHSQGVVHRDLKPGNILLQPKPVNAGAEAARDSSSSLKLEKAFYVSGEFTPRITDFGLAKQLDEASDITSTGQILGTPGFMSPEQAAASEQIDKRTDIYSIGAILYATLIGEPPHQAENKIDTLLQVMRAEPIHVRVRDRRIPRSLALIVHKCLEKDPDKRYASAQELADDLHRCLSREPVHAKPPSWPSRIWRWARQRPALAVTLVSLLVFFSWYMLTVYVIWPEDKLQQPAPTVGFLVMTWLAMAAIFQMGVFKAGKRLKEVLIYAWASLDVVMFTIILYCATGANSPALVVYPLLVAGAGLRYRLRLVWLVCGVSLIGYWWLVLQSGWLQQNANISAGEPIYFSLCLMIIAVIMQILLWRIQQLSTHERP